MKKLELASCNISDESVSLIAIHCKQLECLRVDSCATISDKSLEEITESYNIQLTELYMRQCRISNVVAISLAHHCPNLKILRLDGCVKVTHVGLSRYIHIFLLFYIHFNYT